MQPAIQKIWQKRTKDGYWKPAKQTHGKGLFPHGKDWETQPLEYLAGDGSSEYVCPNIRTPDMDRLINYPKCQTVTSMTKRYKPLSG
jgi:hypothetical protein